MGTKLDVNDPGVALILVLKLQQLKRDSIPQLEYDTLEAYVQQCLWHENAPERLYEAADAILNIHGRDVIRWYAVQSVREAGKEDISAYADVIGGKDSGKESKK